MGNHGWKSRVWVVVGIVFACSWIFGQTGAKPAAPPPEPRVCNAEDNPFDFAPYQYFVPGRAYQFSTQQPLQKICSVTLHYLAWKKGSAVSGSQPAQGSGKAASPYESRVYKNIQADVKKEGNDLWTVKIQIPGRRELEREDFFAPLTRMRFSAYTCRLEIGYESPAGMKSKDLYFRIVDPVWARLIAFACLILLTLMGWGLLRTLKSKSGGKLWEFPMTLATTPGNRYSMSLFQVVIWTYLTVFGIILVWIMTRTFLQITPQVLGLLGIGGGTAAFAKIQTVGRLQRIPLRIRNLIEDPVDGKKRGPKLSDLISEEGGVSLVKFQNLAFTMVVAAIIAFEIYVKHVFPELDANFLILMGISSAVYLGNNLAKPVSEKELADKIEEFDNLLKGTDANQGKVYLKPADLPKDSQKKLQELKTLIDAYMQ